MQVLQDITIQIILMATMKNINIGADMGFMSIDAAIDGDMIN